MPNRPTAMRDEVQLVAKLGDAEIEARCAGNDIDADQTEQQAEHHHARPP